MVEHAWSITALSYLGRVSDDVVPVHDIICRKCHPQTGATLNRDTLVVLWSSIPSNEMKGVLGYRTEDVAAHDILIVSHLEM